jgi:hypothetical protein
MLNCDNSNDPDRHLLDESARRKICEVWQEADRFWRRWFKGGILIDFWCNWRKRGQSPIKTPAHRESASAYSKYDTQSFDYDTQSFKEFESPDITAWKLARAIIEHENNLVNQRLTWLMTSQAFLFTAFSFLFVAWGKGDLNEVRPLIPYFMLGTGLLGIYICLVVQNGLSRAFISLDNVTKHYYGIVEKSFGISHAENQPIPSPRTPPLHNWSIRVKYIDQFYLPSAMALIWLFLLYFVAMYNNPETKGKVEKIIGMGTALTILQVIGVIVVIVIIMIMRRERR